MSGAQMNKQIRRPYGTATYQDVLDAPKNMLAEIINGTLHTHPRPAPKHSFAGSSLGDELISPFQKSRGGPGGWIILDEPEVHLGTDVCVPDIAGWRRETLPTLPDKAYFDTPPDWICEILSPSTRTYDLTDKRDIYGEHGVKHLWFVDPEARTLEAFENTEQGWTLIAALRGDDPVCVPPFEAITFPLGGLWEGDEPK